MDVLKSSSPVNCLGFESEGKSCSVTLAYMLHGRFRIQIDTINTSTFKYANHQNHTISLNDSTRIQPFEAYEQMHGVLPLLENL